MRTVSLVAGIVFAGVGLAGLLRYHVVADVASRSPVDLIVGKVPGGLSTVSGILLVIGLILFLNGLRSSASKPSAPPTSPGPQGQSMISVQAEVLGPSGNFQATFIVDTGASYSVVPRAAAEGVGLKPTGAVQIQTTEGKVTLPLTTATLSVGGRPKFQTELVMGTEPVYALGLDVIERLGLEVRSASAALGGKAVHTSAGGSNSQSQPSAAPSLFTVNSPDNALPNVTMNDVHINNSPLGGGGFPNPPPFPVYRQISTSTGSTPSDPGTASSSPPLWSPYGPNEPYRPTSSVHLLPTPNLSVCHFVLADLRIVLPPFVAAALTQLSDRFYSMTQLDLRVTSGCRTPANQAEQMFRILSDGNTLKHYINQKAAREILATYQRARKDGKSPESIIADIADVIQKQVSKGVYISNHLRGGAVDISKRGMSAKQMDDFRQAVKSMGLRRPVENEGAGSQPHFHVELYP